jgi:hypothetical protein
MYWHCREHNTTQGQAVCLAFFLLAWRADSSETKMSETHSKSRQQAEIAFGNTQTQFFARSHGVEEHDSIIQAREEKTARLREARKAKELVDRISATTALVTKRARKA